MVSVEIIDTLDKGIIKLLSKDGRMSFTEISNRLNVTEKTVRSRYNNLVENNILEVVGVVNPISLGVKVGAIIQISVVPPNMDQTIQQLSDITGIRFITLTSGEYQLLVQANVRDYEEITEIVKSIHQLPGINKSNVILQMDVYKNSFEYI
ncbi:Lrp/AsnC family transcriptional regulator, regulator for asnA, asnC and gidA [Fictibacillus enclensis]|uniref:AsnC family transcriptional regulator n=1 Tax=Fictibacillus enclensis TaxID=1017270 RepID=A0A0V8JCD6_9BACL|nr:Lrp/AsnC family transcriptional regulator [Fictibacillus enclensis]KSU84272.1 AsnC family transcriptional regulator [Fictibacillus enclensis]SCB76254.1 Lrp/AsnC family transcriptional regulator, regulator for asnA, asnC and gidA [Fictibacillus enclensis]